MITFVIIFLLSASQIARSKLVVSVVCEMTVLMTRMAGSMVVNKKNLTIFLIRSRAWLLNVTSKLERCSSMKLGMLILIVDENCCKKINICSMLFNFLNPEDPTSSTNYT